MMMKMRRRRRRRNANVDHVFTMGRKLAADWPADAASRPRWEGFGGSMGSVGVGLGQGVVLISLLNSLSNKVPPYIYHLELIKLCLGRLNVQEGLLGLGVPKYQTKRGIWVSFDGG